MAETTLSFDFDSWKQAGDEANNVAPARERGLIQDLQEGDGAAYETLISQYQQPVYNLVCRLMDNPGDASDVVQEVFLKVFRHIGSFRGQSSLKTWIYRIAVNEAHNHLRWFSRHRKREVRLEQEDGAGGRNYSNTLPDPGRSPFEITAGAETMDLIGRSLARLKPIFRDAVVLRDVEDLSYEEIAEILQVSLGTVKSRILRGREALRKELAGRLEEDRAIRWTPQPAEQD